MLRHAPARRPARSRKRGKKLFSVHKGYSYQSKQLGHLANPQDVEKAALRNPDVNFVIYHSALKHGSSDGENWKAMNPLNMPGRRLAALGKKLDSVCEGWHMTFGYPNQVISGVSGVNHRVSWRHTI